MNSDQVHPSGEVTSAASESMNSVVTGDRLCTRCGYNLVGQSIVREPHYQMLIVRCTECGTVAAVQEYPLLGPWGRRWGAIAAVLFCILLLGAYFGSAGILFGWSMVAADQASWNYQRHIEQAYNEYVIQEREALQATKPAAGAPGPGGAVGGDAASGGVAGNVVVTPLPPQVAFANASADFETWWSQLDEDAMLAQAGGWSSVFDRDLLYSWIPAWIFAAAVGWFWSIALLQIRRRWVLVFGLCILAMCGLFAMIMFAEMMASHVSWAGPAADRQITPPIILLSLLSCAIPIAVGVWLGRPATRLIVRALLAPSVRSSLTILWTAEGLRPPGGVHRARDAP